MPEHQLKATHPSCRVGSCLPWPRESHHWAYGALHYSQKRRPNPSLRPNLSICDAESTTNTSCRTTKGTPTRLGGGFGVDGYVSAIAAVMEGVFRVLKPSGTLFLNLGDTYYSGKGKSHGVDKKSSKRRFGLRAVDKSGGLGIGLKRKSVIGIPWRVATEMCQRDWVLRSPIIWHRTKSLPETVRDRPARGYEFIFLFVKDRDYFFDKSKLPCDSGAEDVWSIPARPRHNGARQTAPFPDELVEQCLAVGCPPGGVVLDPFCGSGTTMRIALRDGHPALGIELNEVFCKYIRADLRRLNV